MGGASRLLWKGDILFRRFPKVRERLFAQFRGTYLKNRETTKSFKLIHSNRKSVSHQSVPFFCEQLEVVFHISYPPRVRYNVRQFATAFPNCGRREMPARPVLLHHWRDVPAKADIQFPQRVCKGRVRRVVAPMSPHYLGISHNYSSRV